MKAIQLFSGGIDSTYTPAKIAHNFTELKLITYSTPGMINLELSRRNASRLKKIYPQISHEIIHIEPFVAKVRGGFLDCIKDNFKYGFYYSWCLGCKLSMHLYTIKYCKQHKIKHVIESSSKYDLHALEQKESVKRLFSSFYKATGIELSTPFFSIKGINAPQGFWGKLGANLTVYDKVKPKKIQYLKNLKLNVGPGIGHQFRSIQPSCTTSLLFNSLRLGLKVVRVETGYIKYLKDKYKRSRFLLC